MRIQDNARLRTTVPLKVVNPDGSAVPRRRANASATFGRARSCDSTNLRAGSQRAALSINDWTSQMDTPKARITGTLRIPGVRREKMQTQNTVKFTLAGRSRTDEQSSVKPENRIWSMKH